MPMAAAAAVMLLLRTSMSMAPDLDTCKGGSTEGTVPRKGSALLQSRKPLAGAQLSPASVAAVEEQLDEVPDCRNGEASVTIGAGDQPRDISWAISLASRSPVYSSMKVVANEGDNIHSYNDRHYTLGDCTSFCDNHPRCRSFARSEENGHCYLKDMCIWSTDPVRKEESDYRTFYKPCNYRVMKVVASEGTHLADYHARFYTLGECTRFCDNNPSCRNFARNEEKGDCYLKGKCIESTDPVREGETDYRTFYKPCQAYSEMQVVESEGATVASYADRFYTTKECERLCEETDACLSFTRNTETGNCWTKDKCIQSTDPVTKDATSYRTHYKPCQVCSGVGQNMPRMGESHHCCSLNNDRSYKLSCTDSFGDMWAAGGFVQIGDERFCDENASNWDHGARAEVLFTMRGNKPERPEYLTAGSPDGAAPAPVQASAGQSWQTCQERCPDGDIKQVQTIVPMENSTELYWEIAIPPSSTAVCYGGARGFSGGETVSSCCCLSYDVAYTVTCTDSGGNGWGRGAALHIGWATMCTGNFNLDLRSNVVAFNLTLPNPISPLAGGLEPEGFLPPSEPSASREGR